MNKSLSHMIGYIILFFIVYHLVKIITQRFIGKTIWAEYDNAWEVFPLDPDKPPFGIAALRSAMNTHFETADDGRLFVVDYSSGNPRWKQVGMDE